MKLPTDPRKGAQGAEGTDPVVADPYDPGQAAHQAERKHRVAGHRIPEDLRREDADHAGLERHDGGRPGLAVDGGKLSEIASRRDPGQGDLSSRHGKIDDDHRALGDEKHIALAIVAIEDGLLAVELPPAAFLFERAQPIAIEAAKQAD